MDIEPSHNNVTDTSVPSTHQHPAQKVDYRPIAAAQLWPNSTARERLWIFGAWFATLLISIGLGLASIEYQWSGLPVHFGGVDFSVTFYPPLILCLFWVLWLGFWWGFIPAYLATLVLALYSGMPFSWSLLFAFADPLGLAVFAIAYRAIPISYRLRSLNSILVFVLISFVSGIFGSSGSFIWTHTNQIASYELLPIWQGWWLGAFLQNLFFVAPLLWLFSPLLLNWRNRHHWESQERHKEQYDILKMTATILGGVLLYLYITIQLAVWPLDTAQAADDLPALQLAAKVLADSTQAIYWVVTIIILFFAFLGYQVFSHWTASVRQSAQELLTTNAALELLSRTDSLTGLYNRRTWEKMLAIEFDRCREAQLDSTLLLLDIDDFKHINDNYGHLAGDEVLRVVAQSIAHNKRDTDIAGRYGGEEFLLVLPNTGRVDGFKLAERLRHLIEETCVLYDNSGIRFTASIGMAELCGSTGDYTSWLAQADQALYEAKKSGRNNTVVFNPGM